MQPAKIDELRISAESMCVQDESFRPSVKETRSFADKENKQNASFSSDGNDGVAVQCGTAQGEGKSSRDSGHIARSRRPPAPARAYETQSSNRAEEPAERAKHAKKKKGGSARMRSREGMPIRSGNSMG